MNYFGHAALAILQGGSSAFILGAMLPDLLPMAGAEPLKMGPLQDFEGDLGRGVRFHLRTDEVFHQTKMFVTENSKTLALLRAQGVSKGPARASAHIGVEMLIDAALARDPRFEMDYLGALQQGVLCLDEVFLRSSLPANRVVGLCSHLWQGGVGLHEATSERLTFRLSRALEKRQRLRPSQDELTTIVSALMSLGEVSAQVPSLLEEMKSLQS